MRKTALGRPWIDGCRHNPLIQTFVETKNNKLQQLVEKLFHENEINP